MAVGREAVTVDSDKTEFSNGTVEWIGNPIATRNAPDVIPPLMGDEDRIIVSMFEKETEGTEPEEYKADFSIYNVGGGEYHLLG